MRLFIAFDLPKHIKTYLLQLQKRLPHGKMRPTADFHLTMQFLGEVSEEMEGKIKKTLKIIVPKPCEVILRQTVGTFPISGAPQCGVIWVGLSVPQSVFDLQRRITAAMELFGFEREERFTPHLTLARVTSVPDVRDFRGALAKIHVEPLRFKLEKYALIQSVATRHGALLRGANYETIAEF